MTAPADNTQPNSKEINFRAQEKAMKDHYERQLAQKDKELEEARNAKLQEDEDNDSEPYVDKKKLAKTLNKFGQQHQQQTQTEIQKAVGFALNEERKNNWLKQNSDFEEVLKHADKLAERDPDLAESILDMPAGFERQKLVYKNIKALGLHKAQEKKEDIQKKIDDNKRGQFYQPSGIGSAPYQGVQSDFSKTGQEAAYLKMKGLINNVRL